MLLDERRSPRSAEERRKEFGTFKVVVSIAKYTLIESTVAVILLVAIENQSDMVIIKTASIRARDTVPAGQKSHMGCRRLCVGYALAKSGDWPRT